MKKMAGLILGLTMFGIFTIKANAFENCVGNISLVESTYMPARVSYMVTCSTPGCPAGYYANWEQSDVDNNKAAYTLLLSALLSGKQVEVFYYNGTCNTQYLHLKQ